MFSRLCCRSGSLRSPRLPFLLADIGEGITEVEILKLHVAPGQAIHQFDPVAEVQSDKATVEITSRYDGTVAAVHYKPGDIARVGKPLIDIDTDASPTSSPDARATARPLASPAEAVRDPQRPLRVWPSARKLAVEMQVDLSAIRLQRPAGVISKQDVLQAVAAPVAPPAAATTSLDAQSASQSRQEAPQTTATLSAVHSASVPLFGLSDELALDAIVARSSGNMAYVHAALLRAFAVSIEKFKLLNAFLSEDKQFVHFRKQVHISGSVYNRHLRKDVAFTILDARNQSVDQILQQVSAAAEKKEEEPPLPYGTVSLLFIPSGVAVAFPTVRAGQSFAGVVGNLRRDVVFSQGAPAETSSTYAMSVSWSGDHRIIDGASCARFSLAFREAVRKAEL